MDQLLLTLVFVQTLLALAALWGLLDAITKWKEALNLARKAIDLAKEAQNELDTFVEAHRLIAQDKAE